MAPSPLVVNASSLHLPSSPNFGLVYTYAHVHQARQSSIFPSNGSPPLSLICLAIGLIAIALSFAFCWRRNRNAHRVVVHAMGHPGRESRRLLEVREKPILWETWTQNVADTVMRATKWENIMPFSVERRCQTHPLPEPGPLQATLSAVRRAHRSTPQPLLAQRPRLLEGENQAEERLPRTLAKGPPLQIAVIIAMPTLRVPGANSSLSLEDMLGRSQRELADFCIGITEVPAEDRWCYGTKMDL